MGDSTLDPSLLSCLYSVVYTMFIRKTVVDIVSVTQLLVHEHRKQSSFNYAMIILPSSTARHRHHQQQHHQKQERLQQQQPVPHLAHLPYEQQN